MMPLREKLKRAFKSNSPSSSKNSSPTISQTGNNEKRWPSNVYRPDEPMPRPKYRAPVKKEHKEKLEAFDFTSSWRRRSHVSLYSPMGSRMPSRRGSRVSRKSISGQSGGGRDSMDARRKSLANGNPSRSNSITNQPQQQADKRRLRHSIRVAQAKQLQAEPERDGDDDVANVGISRINSHEKPPPAINVDPATPAAAQPDQPHRASYFPDDRHGGARTESNDSEYSQPGSSLSQEATPPKADSGPSSQHLVSGVAGAAAGDYKMFTEDELALAMARSRMSSQALPAGV